jgi:hypothetical protein
MEHGILTRRTNERFLGTLQRAKLFRKPGIVRYKVTYNFLVFKAAKSRNHKRVWNDRRHNSTRNDPEDFHPPATLPPIPSEKNVG